MFESRSRESAGRPSLSDLYRLTPPDWVQADPHLRRIRESVLEECGSELLAVLLFGSRLVDSNPDRYSAYDLVLVVEDYWSLFRRLDEAGRLRRSPRLFKLLSGVLPPTNISYRVEPDFPVIAKFMISSWDHLERALSLSAPDHFCLGRLMHRVALIHARSEKEREDVVQLLADARRTSLTWVAPFLREPFSTAEFTRAMLQVSFRGEIRPESDSRPEEVARSQDDFLRVVYGSLLEEACRSDVLVREEGGFRFVRPPSILARFRWGLYFRWSGLRSTARWFKHMLTFEEWLDYIHRKVERRLGLDIELTERDRRYPLIFLWPKLFRVLRVRGKKPRAREIGA